MKIKAVEELVGITKKNIRFYEDEGLLTPGRAENGYREYSEDDVTRLKQIKFLRKLSVPIEEIRKVFAGGIDLDTCLSRHLAELDSRMADLEEMKAITSGLIASGTSLADLDIDTCLEDMQRSEKEGRHFMDVNVTDVHRKKIVGAGIGASLMIAIMGFVALAFIWGEITDPIPIGLFLILLAIPAIIIICVFVVFIQRVREIEGGEEDEAAQY